MIQIPEWHIAASKDESERNPLEILIYENEPVGDSEVAAGKFRKEVEAAIDYAVGIALEKARLWASKEDS